MLPEHKTSWARMVKPCYPIIMLLIVSSLSLFGRSSHQASGNLETQGGPHVEARYKMVWGKECIKELFKTEQTWVEAPLDDNGEPDLKHLNLHGAGLNLDLKCGQFRRSN